MTGWTGQPESIRVIVTDVGGAFGSKSVLAPEAFIAAAMSQRLGVPVKAVESRSLLAGQPGATDEQIRRGLEGNLCRCTGCTPIVAAARSVIEAAGAAAADVPHPRGEGDPACHCPA